MKKKIVYIVAILAIVALIGVKFFSGDKAENKKNQQGGTVSIDVVVVKEKPFNQLIQTKGSLQANELVEIRNEVAGKIETINFAEGQICKKGQLLIKINDDDLRAQLKKTNQNFNFSKDLLERQKSIFDKGGISKSEFDKLQTEFDNYSEEIVRLKKAIEKTAIIAPMNGKIGLRNFSLGSYIPVNSLITNLVNYDPIKVEFSVPEKYAYKISEGSEVTFKVSGDSLLYKAKVFATDALIESTTRSLKVKAKAANPKNKLLAGSFATVYFEINSIENSILIPTQAIVPILKGQKVFVVKNGKASEIIVNTGLRTDAEIEITNGLSVGDTLIVNGVVQVKNNTPVKINKYL